MSGEKGDHVAVGRNIKVITVEIGDDTTKLAQAFSKTNDGRLILSA